MEVVPEEGVLAAGNSHHVTKDEFCCARRCCTFANRTAASEPNSDARHAVCRHQNGQQVRFSARLALVVPRLPESAQKAI